METKKNASKDLENKKVYFFQAGLILSLLVVFTAFQWKWYDRPDIQLPSGGYIFTDIDEIPVTFPEKPELPAPPDLSELQLIDNDDPLEIDDFFVNVDATPNAPVPHYQQIEIPTREEVAPDNHIFVAVEEMPQFPGGDQALLRYLHENTRYPNLAREMNLQGTVFVSFVVEPDGSISNVTIQRGLGGGCDEEALRVFRNMPSWKPGIQAGKPVRVAYSARLVFRLK
jgi:periplasmic protein TonB